MRKRTHIRAGKKYIDFAANIRRQLEPSIGRRVSEREITDGLASFMEEENLTGIFLRRKKKGGGWL